MAHTQTGRGGKATPQKRVDPMMEKWVKMVKCNEPLEPELNKHYATERVSCGEALLDSGLKTYLKTDMQGFLARQYFSYTPITGRSPEKFEKRKKHLVQEHLLWKKFEDAVTEQHGRENGKLNKALLSFKEIKEQNNQLISFDTSPTR